MWQWLIENRTWVFSGVGVSMVALLFGFVRSRATIRQKQRGGNHSVNVQSAGAINVNPSDRDRG
jgi:hypothetical protein